MKIDLSKEQGALVPLYFFRKPLGWPEEERPAAPDRRQTATLTEDRPAEYRREQNTKLGGTAPSTKRPEENEKYEMKNERPWQK